MIPNVPLSKREKEVVKLVFQGKSNKQIALALNISVRTVEFHLKNVYAKFQVSCRMELVLRLGHATGAGKIEELGSSTVDLSREKAEDRGEPGPQMDWTAFRSAVSIIGRELIMKVIMKNPSAFLPLLMSLGAFATVIIYVAIFGTARQPDEGTAAHIWQILVAGQLPVVGFFAIKWLPRAPREALLVLALQGGALVMALAPVYLLKF